MLEKLGLKVASLDAAPPQLSGVHLSALHPADAGDLLGRLQAIATTCPDSGESRIADENNTFILARDTGADDRFSTEPLLAALADDAGELDDAPTVLTVHTEAHPAPAATPAFDHGAFFAALQARRDASRMSPSQFGTFLLYGRAVTSTNTMLDKYAPPARARARR